MTQVATRVLFVCLGNICRSPQAEALCQNYVDEQGLSHHFELQSAGTGSWHIGKGADPRSAQTAKSHGVDLSSHCAQQVNANNIAQWDFFVAMDCCNYDELTRMGVAPEHMILMRFADGEQDVPDPYYGGDQGFENVFNILEHNAGLVMQHLLKKYSSN
ncbi:MAG: low molecular weight protein-tyrosine-phosphatase [Mariprofundaceae bacterium]|nr:low molecular weight protein-tyrosine-phosphatase [Mariprofundaceae bacterium]